MKSARWPWIVAILCAGAALVLAFACTGDDDDDSADDDSGDDDIVEDDDSEDDDDDDDLTADEPEWVIESVDRAAPGNRLTALKIDPAGTVHIAYTGCSDPSCQNSELFHAIRTEKGEWLTESVDDENNDTGWFQSMDINEAGDIFVFYANHAQEKMRYAHKPAGGDWSTAPVGSGRGGWWTSCAFSGVVLHMAHTKLPSSGWDETRPQHVMLIEGDWFFDDIDTTYDSGWFTAMAIGADGMPLVAYDQGYMGGFLKLARLTGEGWDIMSIDESVIKSDVAVDPDGNIHVVYDKWDPLYPDTRDLMYATNASGQWTSIILDPGEPPEAWTGEFPRITSDAHGGLHIAYEFDYESDLIYARDVGQGWEFYTVSSMGTGIYPWIETDSGGGVHISWENSAQIHYAFCPGCALH